MKIVDLLKRESVELNGKVTSKPETIEKMVALMAAGGNLADVEAYKKGVFAREEEVQQESEKESRFHMPRQRQ